MKKDFTSKSYSKDSIKGFPLPKKNQTQFKPSMGSAPAYSRKRGSLSDSILSDLLSDSSLSTLVCFSSDTDSKKRNLSSKELKEKQKNHGKKSALLKESIQKYMEDSQLTTEKILNSEEKKRLQNLKTKHRQNKEYYKD